jgi:glycerophosphoryl diester phosphodiesterase
VRTPRTIAHRGFAGTYPENTVAAARGAASHAETELVEVDAVPTADGAVVCFHDDDLGETAGSRGVTDATGTVWETDTETVLDAAVLGSDATVPLLGDVLDALPEGVGVNVELKNPGSAESRFASALGPATREAERELWAPFVDDVLDALDGFGGEVLVSSFYEGALAALSAAAPSVPAAVLVWDSLADGFEVARRYDADAVHPPWNLVAGTPFAGEPYHLEDSPAVPFDAVARAHEEDRAVNVWTIDTWHRAERLADVGVDGLIADYPGLCGSGGTNL